VAELSLVILDKILMRLINVFLIVSGGSSIFNEW